MNGTTPDQASKFVTIFTLNQRIAGPLLSLFSVLIGYAVLVTAKFSRFGLWRPILTAIFCLIILNFVEGLCLDYVRRTEDNLWGLYLPLLFGFLLAYAIICQSDRVWATSKDLAE